MSSEAIVGIDVAAKTLAVASGDLGGDLGGDLRLRASYANTPAGRGELVAGLRRRRGAVRVVLEATGIYFLDLACDLAAAGIAVMVLNPRVAHHFAEAVLQRRKDDPVDAAMLREYGRRMPFVAWRPPAQNRFALRAIAREIAAQTKVRTAARNRLHAMTATALVPAPLKRALTRQIERLEALIDTLIRAAVKLVAADPELAGRFARIDSMPGFAAKASVAVLAELAVLPPMSARQWVAQAGLDVREVRSGSSVERRPRISKRGNRRLREALFYPALTAARCCPQAAGFVARLTARGKTPLQAQVALMRKLLHAVHALWTAEENFDARKLFATP